MIRDRTIDAYLFSVSFLLLGAVAAPVAYRMLGDDVIASRGGRAIVRDPLPTPQYLQTDARWGSELLAATREPLALSGCTVCCVSMALAHYGIDIPPGELDRRLEEVEGFTRQGFLKWTAVSRVTDGRYRVDVPNHPGYDELDEAIEMGWPVATRVRIKGSINHWVLIVGKRGTEYLARDPLDPRPIVRVSERSAIIEDIRVIRPAD